MKTILVVEDEPRIQRLIGTNLRRSGYRVLQAMNGHEAIIAVETQKTDLIILDTTLPDTAYWDLLVKLKQHEISRALPLIVLSRKVHEEEVFRGGGGVDAYLFKPFDPMELISFVKRLLPEPGNKMSGGPSWVDIF